MAAFLKNFRVAAITTLRILERIQYSDVAKLFFVRRKEVLVQECDATMPEEELKAGYKKNQ